MHEHADLPGPGEHGDRTAPTGEAPSVPVLGSDSRARGGQYITQEFPPVTLSDLDDARDSVQDDRTRRTGTDRDGMETVSVSDPATERRLDRDAVDHLREETCDPAQDNAGPAD